MSKNVKIQIRKKSFLINGNHSTNSELFFFFNFITYNILKIKIKFTKWVYIIIIFTNI